MLKTEYIGNFLGKYAVINKGITRADHIIAGGTILKTYFLGEDGSYIYPVSGSDKVVVSVQQHIVYELDAFYIIVVVLSILLILIGLGPKNVIIIWHKLKNRKDPVDPKSQTK